MTQVFVAATQADLITLTAATDSGAFDETHERLLLTFNDAPVPEVVPPLEQLPAYAALRERFDRTVSYSDLIAPYHPTSWQPTGDAIPVLSRLLRASLGDPAELVVPSLWEPPGRSLAELFPDAALTAYSPGLVVYGPSPRRLPRSITSRIRRLLHLDLLPGLAPLHLSEQGIAAQPVPGQAWLSVVAEVAAGVGATDHPAGEVLLLGEPLATNDGVSSADEEELHLEALEEVLAQGHRRVAYAGHRLTVPGLQRRLQARASDAGVQLVCLPPDVAVECWYAARGPALVVGFLSDSLVTAARFYGIPVAQTASRTLLKRLTPYQHSNRTPLIVVDACVPALDEVGTERRWPAINGSEHAGAALQPLVHAVAYCLQAQSFPHLRATAEQFLETGLDARTRPYFQMRRLNALRLPGAELPAG